MTEHTEQGPVVHTLREEGVKAPEVPADAVARALERFDPDSDIETAVNLLRVAGRLRIEKAADRARALAAHHNPAIRQEARKTLGRLRLDPGPEIAPDPPNLLDLRQLAAVIDRRPRVALDTTRGRFVVELRPDLAPVTALNFLTLVRGGFYDGVGFHRIVPAFVAQAGDPSGTGFGGPTYTIRCEASEESYVRGTLGMALAGPDTGGSQFFITYSAEPHLDRRYTAFGQVVEGLEVVEALQPWDRILGARELDALAAAPAPQP